MAKYYLVPGDVDPEDTGRRGRPTSQIIAAPPGYLVPVSATRRRIENYWDGHNYRLYHYRDADIINIDDARCVVLERDDFGGTVVTPLGNDRLLLIDYSNRQGHHGYAQYVTRDLLRGYCVARGLDADGILGQL